MAKEIEILLDKIKNSGISIRKIAKDLGIPPQRIYGWTIKGATPGYEDVEKLKQFFGQPAENIEAENKIKNYDAIISVLLMEVAALKAQGTGQSLQHIITQLIEASEDEDLKKLL